MPDEFTPQELAAERARRQPREGGRFVKREAAPEPEANPKQDAADAAFMARHADDRPEEDPEAAEAAEPIGEGGVKGAAAGTTAGFAVGGPVGAAVGLAAGFITSKLIQASKAPIGSPEGGRATTQGSGDDIRELLAVTKQIARAGTPIKNAPRTQATGSRM